MKFWMSGEIDADIGDGDRISRQLIEAEINCLLEKYDFPEPMDCWAFVPIILSDKFLPGFPEIVRRSLKRRTLEFRLQISHAEFKSADDAGRISLTLDALDRSVDLMTKLKVSKETQRTLHDLIAQARHNLLSGR